LIEATVYPVSTLSRISTPDTHSVTTLTKLFCARLRDATSVQQEFLQDMSWMLYVQLIRYAQSRPTSFFVGTKRSLGAVYGFDAKYVATGHFTCPSELAERQYSDRVQTILSVCRGVLG
jgi:hypothetical protein